jgi:beta-glucosidase
MTMWEDYPKGIYEMAMLVKKEFNVPVMITENGKPDPDDDGTASRYLVQHLQWLNRAIDDGVDVRGYFYWSLMDNYEWNHGMDMRFGMYGIDENDPKKTRRPRKTVATFAAITKARAVPPDLAKEYGE